MRTNHFSRTKSISTLAGFEPLNLGLRGEHFTSTPSIRFDNKVFRYFWVELINTFWNRIFCKKIFSSWFTNLLCKGSNAYKWKKRENNLKYYVSLISMSYTSVYIRPQFICYLTSAQNSLKINITMSHNKITRCLSYLAIVQAR